MMNMSRGPRKLPAPGPSISISPSGVIAPGGAVTIRCQCRCEARRLFLYKDGIEIWELDAAGDGGEFTIPSARREDGGIYSCRSRSRSEPPNWWYPSDVVRIIVAELRYPKPWNLMMAVAMAAPLRLPLLIPSGGPGSPNDLKAPLQPTPPSPTRCHLSTHMIAT
nr:leukocyte-associated immunoglobulin-like receptor 2 [Chrysemys picta bellii]